MIDHTEDEVPASDHDEHAKRRGDSSVLEKVCGQRGGLGEHDLPYSESDHEHTTQSDESNDARVIPLACVSNIFHQKKWTLDTYSVGLATPLQSQQNADGPGGNERSAWEIKLFNLFHEGELHGILIGNPQEADDGDHGDTANGQVDVKAPSPCHVGSEGASDERTCDLSRGHASTNSAKSLGTVFERYHMQYRCHL